jgi:hypothetical protein
MTSFCRVFTRSSVTRGRRGGRCHSVDSGVALFVDQRQSYLIYALGLLKVCAQGGEPRVGGLGFKELSFSSCPELFSLCGLLFHLPFYGLILLGLLLFGLLLDRLILLFYLLLSLLLDSLVPLVYLLLGQPIDSFLFPRPCLLLGLIGLLLDLLFCLLLCLLGLLPAGARKAIGTEPLARSGNLSPSRLLAAWLSVPGSERLSFVSWPRP